MKFFHLIAVFMFGAACLTGCGHSPVPADRETPIQQRTDMTEKERDMWAGHAARFQRWKIAPPQGTGPYRIVREEHESLPRHTIFRPARLSDVDPLPVIGFANGGCRNTPIEFTAFLAEIASHGYFIIAAGTNDVPFATTSFAPFPDGTPAQIVGTEVLTDATDWAEQENAREGGIFHGELDPGKVAYVGQSCGGMQVLSASRDPRVTTTVVLNSGRFPRDGRRPFSNAAFPPWFEWSELHGPIAFFTGGPTDTRISHDNYAEIDHLPVFLADLPVGHTGAYPEPDRRWSNAVIGWLDWLLKGDEGAGELFAGPHCGLCGDPDWTVKGGKRLNEIP